MKMLWNLKMRIIVAVPVVIASLTIASGFLVLHFSRSIIAHAGVAERAADIMQITLWIMAFVTIAVIAGLLLGVGIVRPLNRLMEEAKNRLSSESRAFNESSEVTELDRLNNVFRQTLMSLDQYITDSYILNQLPESVISIDNRGTINKLNRLAADTFGYKPEEMIAKRYSEVLFDTSENQGLCKLIKESLDQNRSYYTQRATVRGNNKVVEVRFDLHLIPESPESPEKEQAISKLLIILHREKEEKES